MCYYFDDIMRVEDINFDDILLDGKYFLTHDKYKTFIQNIF